MASRPDEGLSFTGKLLRFRLLSPGGWVLALLALGLGLRLYHYLHNPSVWHDEAALILNVLDKNYAALLGPLRFSEAAPPLFLWAEKAAADLGGTSPFALRLFPLMASLAALVGIWLAARRILSPAATLWLLLLFGCSDRLLWHCCEAKPYAVDAAVAAGLLIAFTRTAAWPLERRLLFFAALSPGLIFLSYPACFLLGGLALSLLPEMIRCRRLSSWLWYGLFLLAAGGSSGLLLAGPIHAQRDPTILQCWWDMFPDWSRPWTVPAWEGLRLVEVFRYALEPVGNVLFPVACVGAVLLWRAGQRSLVIFLVGPLGLACLASLLGQYPVGATRVMVFAAPAALLLIAAGLPPTLAWLKQRAAWGMVLLIGLILFPLGQVFFRMVQPWPRFDSRRAAGFVRAHWQPAEAVIGTSWEHEFYFRDQLRRFRFLSSAAGAEAPQNTPENQTSGLWLLAVGKAKERRSYLADLQGSGPWVVQEAYEFQRTTVFHLLFSREPLASVRRRLAAKHFLCLLPGEQSTPPRTRP